MNGEMLMDKDFPALPKSWVEEFVFELRMRDVPGERIGALLAEAQSHVRASGEDAYEAFGEPRSYARQFEGASSAELQMDVRRTLVFGAITVVSFWLFTSTWGPWLVGQNWSLNLGSLLVVVLLAAVALSLAKVLPTLVRRPALAILGNMAVLAALVALLVWGGPVLLTVPAGVPAVVGGVTLFGCAIAQTLLDARGSQDNIVEPGQPQRRGVAPSTFVAYWMLPVLALVIALITMVMR